MYPRPSAQRAARERVGWPRWLESWRRRTLRLHAAPGGGMDAVFAALPGAVPPVAAACGLTEEAATSMLELGEAAGGAGCLGGLAAACVRGMREHLEPPLLCRLAALEEAHLVQASLAL